jgi:hypothetical protein
VFVQAQKRPAQLSHHSLVSGRHPLPACDALDTAAGHDLHPASNDRVKASRGSGRADGAGQAVLGTELQTGSSCEHFVACDCLAVDADKACTARRKRSGLIKRKQPRLGEELERPRVAYDAPVSRQPPNSERGRKGRSEPHGARTGHHQHRKPNKQCTVEAQVLRPIDRRPAGQCQDPHHKNAGHPVGDALR